MEFKARVFDPLTIKSDCLVLLIPGKGKLGSISSALDEATNSLISNATKQGELLTFLASINSFSPTGINSKRLVVISTGGKSLTLSDQVKIADKIASSLKNNNLKSAAICLGDAFSDEESFTWLTRQVAKKITENQYQSNHCKSQKKASSKLSKVSLLAANTAEGKSLTADLNTGASIGLGINTARHLGDLPANICTPSYLANTAKNLAKDEDNISVKVLSEKQMTDLKMGSLLSVTAGTDTPAKMVILDYKGGKKSDKPVVLVGKGVTFDSGGISLKPGGGMDEMKYDMCGAASVFGVITAIARLELKLNVVGIIPAVENMPSGKATKPGDIVTSMSGQTIEILNTDAEGRLILCDALTYAERYKPTAVIDIATLTGACVIALGSHTTGLLSNDDELAEALFKAGEDSADKAWRLPLGEEYDQQLKSNFADMANIGGRGAGTITAACFLNRFAKNYPWAHLDIAGTAWKKGAQKGATGRPVGLLVEYLSSLSNQ